MLWWWLLLSTGSAEKVQRGTPPLDCFGGDYLESAWFPEHLCCDAEQWPPTGWWKCWGGDFTYENCCGEGPSCTDEMVAEVWKFLAPKSDRSYRALWSSNTYYGIARVRKESQCQLPFVASRVLALTKLDWIEQWEILHFPRRATYHSNFQLRSIVDAMWTMIQDVSLEDFLTSGKWAETILTRLYGHSKKTAYYLLSDGMPLLSGRLPVSDAFLSKEDEDFQHLLRRRLNLHLPLPITDAKNYLKRNATAAFGRICASLVMSLEFPAYLQRAEELLRSWVEKNDYGDLFFSHWPIYRLMLYLHRKLSRDSHAEMYSETAKLSQSMQRAWEQSAEMLVISCLPDLTGSLPQGWHHILGCHGSWRQLLEHKNHKKVRWVLLISSTMHWSDHHVGSIREGLALAEEAGKMAVGFPTIDRSGTWRWPVRRFEMDGNLEMVRYLPYPTGYAGSQGRCCRGDTTSGTRAYHWNTLARLFEEADRFGSGAETMSILLQRLDFLGQSNSKGYASMTCMVPPLVEDDYAKTILLHHSDLPDDMQKMVPQSRPSHPVTLPISQDFFDSRRSALGSQEADEVAVLYCGELNLKIESRFVANIFQESLRNCAQILRRAAKRLPVDSWVLFLSPFMVDGVVDMKFVEVLRHALHGQPHALAVGTTTLRGEDEDCCARSITYRFYKLQYRRMVSPNVVPSCFSTDASSGTRLYRPGVLPELLKKTVTMDVGTLMVELDLLAKLGGSPPSRLKRPPSAVAVPSRERSGRILTCVLPEGTRIPREEDYLQKAQLPDAFVQLFQVEAADYTGRMLVASNPAIVAGAPNGTDWQLAHNVADQRIATSLLYRRRIEDDFMKIVKWWTMLDEEKHFAAPKQGTLLTAMIRGGDVSMMPWDTDLELALYSTGANPVLGWCDDILDLQERRGCVLRRLEEELQMPIQLGPDQFFSQWLYETHLTFAKFRVNVAWVFDVNFESYVKLFPIQVPMFGEKPNLRVSWPTWEHLFFEVFQGSFEKKVGTSGNIAASVQNCALDHNACIPDCERSDGPCDFEFQDYFAHSRDAQGRFFPD